MKLGDRGRAELQAKIDEYYTEGLQAYADGKLQESIEYWNKVLELDPEQASPLTEIASHDSIPGLVWRTSRRTRLVAPAELALELAALDATPDGRPRYDTVICRLAGQTSWTYLQDRGWFSLQLKLQAAPEEPAFSSGSWCKILHLDHQTLHAGEGVRLEFCGRHVHIKGHRPLRFDVAAPPPRPGDPFVLPRNIFVTKSGDRILLRRLNREIGNALATGEIAIKHGMYHVTTKFHAASSRSRPK